MYGVDVAAEADCFAVKEIHPASDSADIDPDPEHDNKRDRMPTHIKTQLLLFVLILLPCAAHAQGTLVFTDNRGISIKSTMGTRSRTILESDAAAGPVWSPAGDRIALTCHDAQTQASDICTMSPDGSDLVRRTQATDARYSSPTWSPDGQRIAFLAYPPIGSSESSSQLLAIPADGGQPQVVTTTDRSLANPAWSPDGRWIAVESLGIRLISTEGLDPIQLTEGPGRDLDPSWSPDSRHIVFSSNRLGGCPDLFIIEVDTADLRQLTPTESCGTQPAWSPDGTMIAYVSPTTTDLEIHLMQPDGTEVGPLIVGSNPDWAPVSYVTSVQKLSWGMLKARWGQ